MVVYVHKYTARWRGSTDGTRWDVVLRGDRKERGNAPTHLRQSPMGTRRRKGPTALDGAHCSRVYPLLRKLIALELAHCSRVGQLLRSGPAAQGCTGQEWARGSGVGPTPRSVPDAHEWAHGCKAKNLLLMSGPPAEELAQNAMVSVSN